MRKLYFLLSFFTVSTFAQQVDSLFAIVNKPLPNTATSNTNSLLRVGKLNPAVGFVSNIGSGVNNSGVPFSITGGSVNQINNTFNLVGSNSFRTFSLNTGNLLANTPITSFTTTGTTYFDNVRFNNSNASLYGLARVNIGSVSQGIYLAKLNTDTGNLIQISQNSVGNLVAVNGIVINPDLMVYYYSTASKLVGLDLYNGTIFSNPDVVYDNDEFYGFADIAFNCSNSEIYGLIRGKYLDQNATLPTGYTYYFRLGKINPTTGVVTQISTQNLPSQFYAVNSGATIDETNGIYYFAGPNTIYGISLVTGAVVSTAPISFEDGNVLFFMTNYNNCINRTALRQDPSTLSNSDFSLDQLITIYPNPTASILKIKTSLSVDKVEIIDNNGRLIQSAFNATELNVSSLASGIYFVKIYSQNIVKNLKFIKH